MPPPNWIETCKTSLLDFTQEVFYRRRKVEFLYNWHHSAICDALEKVVLGETKRLIINLPPRYSKTEIAVVNFIAWSLGLYPDSEFIHISYTSKLATNNSYNCRELVFSDVYRQIFPHIQLMNDSNAKNEWRTTQGGVVYASGAEGTLTGYGAGKMREGFGGCILIDDPHKALEADSETMRQNVIDWFQTTLESRTNSPDTPIIIIMQRLHENDLSGFLLGGGNGEHWDHVCIPVLDENEVPLWEAKHTLSTLKRMSEKNPYVFAGQYLQKPAPREGGTFKRIWVQKTRYNTPPDKFISITQSWDTAYKESEINDPSVCTTWGETEYFHHYLLYVLILRGDYPAVKRAVKSQYLLFRPNAVLIEDKSSGQSLIQELKAEIPVIAIEPDGNKLMRAYTVTPYFETERIWLPEEAPWLPEYESELFLFPKAKHDDCVDSTSQYLNWKASSSLHGSSFFVIDGQNYKTRICEQCTFFNNGKCGQSGVYTDKGNPACRFFM